MSRNFEIIPAVRQRVPLLVGIVGPSGSGKTYSALRLATGIQRVHGGEIFVIDTEGRRALHYADRFKFKHLAFGAPFSPADYLDAMQACVQAGAKTVVVDSASHVHEGEGGMLEAHDAELKRLGGSERMNFTAWIKPKKEITRMINWILQSQVNFLFCFRAREKMKILPGKEPKHLGFMPIATDAFIYEQTLNLLLLPGSKGVPSWHPEEMGEKAVIKLPVQFESIFEKEEPLSEDIGAKLAEWAAGGAKPAPSAVPSIIVSGVSKSEKDGKTVYLVTSSAGTYATMDAALAAVASSLVGKPARVSATQTAKGGWKLTAIEPVEEAA